MNNTAERNLCRFRRNLVNAGFGALGVIMVWVSLSNALLAQQEPAIRPEVNQEPKAGQIVGSGQESLTLKGHSEGVTSVAFSPDGKRLASASWDKTVKVWDAATGRELFTLQLHTDAVVHCAFSPDGKGLASASSDRTVIVWDTATGQESFTLRAHPDKIGGVAFSPDGKRLASAGRDSHLIMVWDLATGQRSFTLTRHGGGPVTFSPDGRVLAAVSFRAVTVWDAATGKELFTTKEDHNEAIRSVVFSPDARRLTSVSFDANKVWDSATGQELKVWEAVAGQESKLWDIFTGKKTLTLKTLKENTNVVFRLALSPDGKRLASASGKLLESRASFRAQEINVWDAVTGQELVALKGFEGIGKDLAFSPDGKLLVLVSSEPSDEISPPGQVNVWDAATGRELLALKGFNGFIKDLAFSPDGNRLAVPYQDNTVKVWNLSVRRRREY